MMYLGGLVNLVLVPFKIALSSNHSFFNTCLGPESCD